jgi:hypothetical protein
MEGKFNADSVRKLTKESRRVNVDAIMEKIKTEILKAARNGSSCVAFDLDDDTEEFGYRCQKTLSELGFKAKYHLDEYYISINWD